jgi:L-asparagine transporter-like permease
MPSSNSVRALVFCTLWTLLFVSREQVQAQAPGKKRAASNPFSACVCACVRVCVYVCILVYVPLSLLSLALSLSQCGDCLCYHDPISSLSKKSEKWARTDLSCSHHLPLSPLARSLFLTAVIATIIATVFFPLPLSPFFCTQLTFVALGSSACFHNAVLIPYFSPRHFAHPLTYPYLDIITATMCIFQ